MSLEAASGIRSEPGVSRRSLQILMVAWKISTGHDRCWPASMLLRMGNSESVSDEAQGRDGAKAKPRTSYLSVELAYRIQAHTKTLGLQNGVRKYTVPERLNCVSLRALAETKYVKHPASSTKMYLTCIGLWIHKFEMHE